MTRCILALAAIAVAVLAAPAQAQTDMFVGVIWEVEAEVRIILAFASDGTVWRYWEEPSGSQWFLDGHMLVDGEVVSVVKAGGRSYVLTDAGELRTYGWQGDSALLGTFESESPLTGVMVLSTEGSGEGLVINEAGDIWRWCAGCYYQAPPWEVEYIGRPPGPISMSSESWGAVKAKYRGVRGDGQHP